MTRTMLAIISATALLTVFSGVSHGTAVGVGITELLGPGNFVTTTNVINFDGQPNGTAANNLYVAQGVQFQNSPSNTTVPIIDWTALSRVTTSPDNVIATEAGVNGSQFSGFLDLFFSSPTTEVGAYYGNDQGILPDAMLLEVYDSGNNLLGFVTENANLNTSVDQFLGLRSTTPFTRARFINQPTSGNLSVTLDDVRFSAPVPEPSTLALLSTGALPLLARWRRKSSMKANRS